MKRFVLALLLLQFAISTQAAETIVDAAFVSDTVKRGVLI